MKINRSAFTFPHGVWLVSMEIQEIQTSPQFFPPRNSRVVSSREPKPESASPSHSSKVLQEHAVEKGCEMKPVKQNQKMASYKNRFFRLAILQLWKRRMFWGFFWESSIPVLPCIDSGEVGLGKFRSSFPHILSTQNEYLTSLWWGWLHLDVLLEVCLQFLTFDSLSQAGYLLTLSNLCPSTNFQHDVLATRQAKKYGSTAALTTLGDTSMGWGLPQQNARRMNSNFPIPKFTWRDCNPK